MEADAVKGGLADARVGMVQQVADERLGSGVFEADEGPGAREIGREGIAALRDTAGEDVAGVALGEELSEFR